MTMHFRLESPRWFARGLWKKNALPTKNLKVGSLARFSLQETYRRKKPDYGSLIFATSRERENERRASSPEIFYMVFPREENLLRAVKYSHLNYSSFPST